MSSEWVSFGAVKRQAPMTALLRWYQVDWLRPRGPHQLHGRCPIHQGEGPEAFHVHLPRNLFHCFACGAGGNVLDFVAAMEHCTIRQAALKLQRQGGEERWRPADPDQLVRERKRCLRPLPFTLKLDIRHPYLAQRGIDEGTARHFGVGYHGGRGLMAGRIAIPVHDSQGRLVAYVGRAVDGLATPRYRLPPGFAKSRVLFNYHRARTSDSDQVIVVEGFFDCLRAHQAGFPAVVALMGAGLSPTQQCLLTERFSEVTLLLDGDATGWAATMRITRQLATACQVNALRLPPGQQPDQMAAEQIQLILARYERRLLPAQR